MKCLILAAFIASALAEPALSSNLLVNSTMTLSEDTTTITEYFSDCSTLPVTNLSYTATTTAITTDILPCHECTMDNGIYTTYETVYSETCSTGLTAKTYTIVEQCSETDQPRPTNYVPQGFVVTTVACAPCEEATVTLTTPGTKALVPATVVVPTTTPAPVNTSTVCHSCNQTITSIQFGTAGTTSIGLSVALFSVIAGMFWLL